MHIVFQQRQILGGSTQAGLLSAPLSSVASEQLFSAAAEIYNDRRNRLIPARADMADYARCLHLRCYKCMLF